MLAKFEITSDIMQAAHWYIFFSKINKMRFFRDHIVIYANLCIWSIRREGRKEGGRRAQRLTQISSLDLTTLPPSKAIVSTHFDF